jgi:hypothetical protein
MPLFLVGFVALLAFFVIPYRIYKLHEEGDAEFGDYAFMLFLAIIIPSGLVILIADNT